MRNARKAGLEEVVQSPEVGRRTRRSLREAINMFCAW